MELHDFHLVPANKLLHFFFFFFSFFFSFFSEMISLNPASFKQ